MSPRPLQPDLSRQVGGRRHLCDAQRLQERLDRQDLQEPWRTVREWGEEPCARTLVPGEVGGPPVAVRL